MHRIRTFVYVLLFAGAVSAQESEPTMAELQVQANEAYQRQDFETFYANLARVHEQEPNHPVILYNLACGAALTGRDSIAIGLLSRLADRRIDYNAAHDPDLQSLRGNPAFDSLLVVWAKAFEPIHTSEQVYSHPQVDLLPEGMAIDPRSGTVYFGSMRFGRIYRIDSTGVMTEFAAIDAGQPMSVLGMEVDTVRNRLWANGLTFFMHAEYDSAAGERCGVFWFDLADGRQGGAYLYTGSTPGTAFNDLAVSSDGDVYLSGTGLFHVPAGDSVPRVYPLQQPLPGSNGITLTPGERYLYVTYSGRGIVRVDLADGSWHMLDSPDDLDILGFDGLYYYRGSLVGIQNGIQPWRAMQLHLSGDGKSVTSATILEIKHPELVSATTGDVVGDQFFYVARTMVTQAPSTLSPALHPFLGAPRIMRTTLSADNQTENGL